MDDIEKVIKLAKHLRFEGDNHKLSLNRASSLPAPKAKLKDAIKERIRTLYGVYIALASFVSDEDIDSLINDQDKNKEKIVFNKVLKELENNREEIKKFEPF